MTEIPQHGAGSQTLSRGLQALDILASAGRPLTIADLATRLEVHRSSAYRLLRSLEEHRYVVRDQSGMIRLGSHLATLARGVSPQLQTAALPAITSLANLVGMTAFLAVREGDEVVTLVSVEPSSAGPVIASRPGARHPLSQGAPGHAIESILNATDHLRLFGGAERSPAARSTAHSGYAVSTDEVVPGLTSLAVPLEIPGESHAALAVVTIGMPAEPQHTTAQLHACARQIAHNYR